MSNKLKLWFDKNINDIKGCLPNGEKFESVNNLIDKLKEYIYYYNNERIILKLKMSPVKYRTQNQII